MKVLTQLNLVLQVILLGGVLDGDAVAEELHQVPLGRGQQEVIPVEDDSGVVQDKLSVLLKLAAVCDPIQFRLNMIHNLFYFNTVFNTPALKIYEEMKMYE